MPPQDEPLQNPDSSYARVQGNLGPTIVQNDYRTPSESSSLDTNGELYTAGSSISPNTSQSVYNDVQNPASDDSFLSDREEADNSPLLDRLEGGSETDIEQTADHHSLFDTLARFINKLTDLWYRANEPTTDYEPLEEETRPQDPTAEGCCDCLDPLFKAANKH